MPKVATPIELANELRHILRAASSANPSRNRLATMLADLGRRVATEDSGVFMNPVAMEEAFATLLDTTKRACLNYKVGRYSMAFNQLALIVQQICEIMGVVGAHSAASAGAKLILAIRQSKHLLNPAMVEQLKSDVPPAAVAGMR